MANYSDADFNALRARARAKRDKGIAILRDEYERMLAQIAALEQDLLGARPSSYKKISAAVESVIPRDRPFNIQDIMASLEAIDPTRAWRKRSVDWIIVSLRKKGILQRIKRASIHEGAVYIRAEAAPPKAAVHDMTLLEAIGKVLTKPMTSSEICVAVVESGYKSTMARNNLRNHAVRLLGLNGYKQADGKWLP